MSLRIWTDSATALGLGSPAAVNRWKVISKPVAVRFKSGLKSKLHLVLPSSVLFWFVEQRWSHCQKKRTKWTSLLSDPRADQTREAEEKTRADITEQLRPIFVIGVDRWRRAKVNAAAAGAPRGESASLCAPVNIVIFYFTLSLTIWWL